MEELNRQWYEHETYWENIFSSASKIDELIMEVKYTLRLLMTVLKVIFPLNSLQSLQDSLLRE